MWGIEFIHPDNELTEADRSMIRSVVAAIAAR
jgi:hypothetical protein